MTKENISAHDPLLKDVFISLVLMQIRVEKRDDSDFEAGVFAKRLSKLEAELVKNGIDPQEVLQSAIDNLTQYIEKYK